MDGSERGVLGSPITPRSTPGRQKQRPVTLCYSSSTSRPKRSAGLKDSSETSPPLIVGASSPSSGKSKRTRILFYDKNDLFHEFTHFSPHDVTYKGKRYPTSEHLFQAFKFLDDYPEVARFIRKCGEEPMLAFDEAHRYQNWVRSDWKQVQIKKREIALYHKFTQHLDLKALLLGTGDAELIYSSPRDSFWGIGADHSGRNELGKALMRLRTVLREERDNPYKAPAVKKDITRLAAQDLTSGAPARPISNANGSYSEEQNNPSRVSTAQNDTSSLAAQDVTSDVPTRRVSNPNKIPGSRKDNARHSVAGILSFASDQPVNGPGSKERDSPYKISTTRKDNSRYSVADISSLVPPQLVSNANRARSEARDSPYKVSSTRGDATALLVQHLKRAAQPQGSGLCEACHTRPKYIEGTKTHPYCGKTCAAKMKNICGYCHKQPKYDDGETTNPFCGKTCARRAMAAGDVDGASAAPSKPLKNGCLLCGKSARKGHFCSQVCSSWVDKSAPLLLEVHSGHDMFKSVVDQFTASWRHPTSCPNVSRVYKVIGHPTSISKYEAYQASVEARGKFTAAGRSPGNENRRWHGTRRECLLGDNGNTTLCSSPSCSLCNIIRTSYSLKCFGKKTGWGRFGAGIYLSSTSSKSNDYSNNVQPSKHKAILLNKVVVGKGYKMTRDSNKLTAPPRGYDSVLAEVAAGGSLNYDELVCYTENAVRPSYLLIYDA